MRIIGGKYRGKKLLTPDGNAVRPPSDRMREALFNILYSRVGPLTEINVLDVFAGTGAFGLESISRGAKSVTMIDKDTKLIAKNTSLFPEEKNKINIIQADATNLLTATKKYHLLFMDAPYAQGLTKKALLSLSQKKWLINGALCLIETRRDEILQLPKNFNFIEERLYGLAKISILTYSE